MMAPDLLPPAQGFRGSAVPGSLLVLEWALTADHWLDYKTVRGGS